MSHKKIIILISFLTFATLACSLTSVAKEQVEEIAATQIADVVSPEEADAPVDSDSSGFISPQLAQDIHAFRIRISYNIVSADDTSKEVMKTEGEYINDTPPSNRIVMTVDANEESEAERVEYIRIGTKVWMHYADQWMSLDDDSVDFLSDMLPNASDTADMDWEKIGEEEVNGIKTTHYRVTDTYGTADWLKEAEAETNDEFNFTAEKIDIYVSKDNVIIKQEIHAEGEMTAEDGSTQPVSMDFNFDVYDINANDIIIKPPSDEEFNSGSQLPLPENAKSTLNSVAFSTYNISDGNIESVVAFYETNAEITISSNMGSAETGYILVVQYAEKDYTLTISPAEKGGVDISILSMSE